MEEYSNQNLDGTLIRGGLLLSPNYRIFMQLQKELEYNWSYI